MSDSNLPSWVNNATAKTTRTGAASPAEKSTQQATSQPVGATDLLSAMLWIQGNDGRGRAVNYSHIEEIETDAQRERLRLYLPRSVVDVTTPNMGELVTLLGRRKLASLSAGQINDDITVTEVTIYSHDRLPQAPEDG